MKKILMLFVLGCLLGFILYALQIIPHVKYSNEDFDIETLMSSVDKDLDGIDDQSDILMNVKEYIQTKPKYKSQYYGTGYPDDQYGVCTDVVAFGLKDAGYDLMELVYEDVLRYPEDYKIELVDKKIDFRRVKNLLVYFNKHALSLTTDIYDIEQWQGGDIVVFHNHIGIVSDHRNKKGITYIIHHANPFQLHYEEDILERHQDIVGHFRMSE